MTEKEMKFWQEVRLIVTMLEQAFLRERNPMWGTTKEFSEQFGKYYDYAYKILRGAADFWNENLSKDYGAMYDCDFHGYKWKFFRNIQDLKDLCWIAAIRTHGHNKRALNNFGFAGEINSGIKKEVKIGKTDVIIPSSVKNYEDNNTEN